MAVSLGEAISLQGRNTGAEQLGRAAFQSAQAEAARTAKRAMVGAQQAEKREDKLIDLFRDKSNFHRLVLPEVGDLLTKTLNKMQEIKSSGSPYASNQFDRLYSETAFQLNSYITASNELKNFDKSTDYIDINKKFYGENLPEFMQVYSKASRLSDLQKYVQEKPGLAADPYLVLTPNGIPQVHEKPAIPFEKILQDNIKLVPESILASQVRSLPNAFDSKELLKSKVRPFRRIDAELAYKNNKNLFPEGQPISIEDVVENFLLGTPGAIEQISVRKKLGLVPQTDGSYTAQDMLKVKESLMNDMKMFVSPKMSEQIIRPPSAGQGTPSPFQSVYEPSKTKETAMLVGVVAKVNDEKRTVTNLTNYSFVNFGIDGTVTNLNFGPNVVDEAGNTGSGSERNVNISAVRLMPYKQVGNAKRPLHSADNQSKLKGVYPFVELSVSGKTYYVPWDSGIVTVNMLGGGKFDVTSIRNVIDKMKREAVTINEEWAKQTDKSWMNFNTFVFDKLTFQQ